MKTQKLASKLLSRFISLYDLSSKNIPHEPEFLAMLTPKEHEIFMQKFDTKCEELGLNSLEKIEWLTFHEICYVLNEISLGK